LSSLDWRCHPLDERSVPATVKAMTEQDIMKAAASLRGKRSWAARLKKAGGKKAAAKQMRLLRARRVMHRKPEKA